jgi:class 3 adenylate cyclase
MPDPKIPPDAHLYEPLLTINPTRLDETTDERKWLDETIAAYEKLRRDYRENNGDGRPDLRLARHLIELREHLSEDRLRRLLRSPERGRIFDSLAEGARPPATVMSIDIRKSTDLMQNARDSAKFARFLSELTEKIYGYVMEDYGVYEKFTGDGVLAFFPESLAGSDHPLRAMRCANNVHAAFNGCYEAYRHIFRPAIVTGLGIGLASDAVEVVRIRRRLSIVGKTVVEACRLAGGNAGETLCDHDFKEAVTLRSQGSAEFAPWQLKTKRDPWHVYKIKYKYVDIKTSQWE